ncbi:hypothetical protein Q31b_50060 [Novipirellula aureliae]|uniref:Uncharacterized protein n=1 Tax=Novipirellula aureliae TaxID=2527966 RepID=A0A5C6DKU8_9BACT|nr:hypothetical protein Q31b_50060 [Novipirellula aureliae]
MNQQWTPNPMSPTLTKLHRHVAVGSSRQRVSRSQTCFTAFQLAGKILSSRARSAIQDSTR